MNLLRPTPDRLTKHLLPLHTVEAADELLSQLYPAPSTPLRSAQNDRAIEHRRERGKMSFKTASKIKKCLKTCIKCDI